MSLQMKAGLWQQQTMKLAMTQELTQAITLLQYSTQELTEYLEMKSLENPFIHLEMTGMKALKREKPVKNGQRLQEYREKNWIEHVADSSAHTLIEHLKLQLAHLKLNRRQQKMLNFLLYNIDENGYLTVNIVEVAEHCRCRFEEAEKMVQLIRELEPAGIGAFNLRDCLLLQLNRIEGVPDHTITIIEDHFADFAEKNWKALAKKLGIELRDIQVASDFIRTLNPRPGARFQTESLSYVKPDLMVKVEQGSIEVQLVDDELPKIVFQKNYFNKLSKKDDRQLKNFINEKHKDYVWLLKSLEQRNQTIKRVGLKIVEKQNRFFFDGPPALQPLTMGQIADELNIHESTVSRAVRGKYMQTPFGTFELKYFFPAGVSTEGTEAASAQQVKSIMQRLIDQENKKKPLSDQDITTRLQEEGVNISRRTVAKYREQMNILPSSKRKRYE
ncbi:MAG TPA: RNA polymerase factor sigma-54 [Chondromyces sp.]|nr:RNA polymerase factor sigma-54 [Chondromyces sp.]